MVLICEYVDIHRRTSSFINIKCIYTLYSNLMVLIHRLKQAQFAHLTNSALSNCLTIVSITVIHRHPWHDLSLSFIKEYIHILDKVKHTFTEIGVIPRSVMPRALARGVYLRISPTTTPKT